MDQKYLWLGIIVGISRSGEPVESDWGWQVFSALLGSWD